MIDLVCLTTYDFLRTRYWCKHVRAGPRSRGRSFRIKTSNKLLLPVSAHFLKLFHFVRSVLLNRCSQEEWNICRKAKQSPLCAGLKRTGNHHRLPPPNKLLDWCFTPEYSTSLLSLPRFSCRQSEGRIHHDFLNRSQRLHICSDYANTFSNRPFVQRANSPTEDTSNVGKVKLAPRLTLSRGQRVSTFRPMLWNPRMGIGIPGRVPCEFSHGHSCIVTLTSNQSTQATR